jgi:nucleotide-binding universal stress UspA family protein
MNSFDADVRESPLVIVAAVDMSPFAPRVLATARKLTRQAGDSELHIIHVLPPSALPLDMLPIVDRSGGACEPFTRARTALEEMCGNSVGVERPRVRLYIHAGDVVAEVRALADALDADCIVVGTMGRRGLSRMIHGSISERLLREATCSVMTVRAENPAYLDAPCRDCVETQFATRGAVAWCARHAEHHVRAHRYHGAPPEDDGSRSFRFHA